MTHFNKLLAPTIGLMKIRARNMSPVSTQKKSPKWLQLDMNTLLTDGMLLSGLFSNSITVECIFPMVISSEFRMRQHGDDDHREDTTHFT